MAQRATVNEDMANEPQSRHVGLASRLMPAFGIDNLWASEIIGNVLL